MTAARRDERGRDGRGDAPPDMFGNAVDAAGNVEDVGHVSLRGALGATVRVATQGRAVAEKEVGLAVEAVRIGVGRSAVAPAPNDWRFKHPAWSENPVYRRVAQLYLAGHNRGMPSQVDTTPLREPARLLRRRHHALHGAQSPRRPG
jgi:hypothetical protein